MPKAIATLVCAFGIVALFILDRNSRTRTSKALWLPVVYMWIAGSRAISQWLVALGWGGGASWDSPDQYIDGSPLDRNVLAVFLMLGLLVLVSRGRQVGTLLRANGPILLFFIYCAFSAAWSDYPDVAFKRWIKAVGDLVMVLIVLTDSEPLAALKRLLARVGFLLLPLSVLFIKYYPVLGRNYSHSWQQLYTGVTDQKNTLGMSCLVLGLGFLWCLLEHYRTKGEPHRGRHLFAHGAMLAMVMWLFWISNSMTALASFLVAGGLLVVISLHRLGRKPAVMHLLVTGMLLVTLFAVFSGSGGSLLGTMGRDSTLTGRTDLWPQVLGLAGNPWFGTGFESFWLGDRLQTMWSNNPGFRINEAHNGYIEVYLNLGWCGVALLAILIVTGYRNVMATFRQDAYLGGLKLAYFLSALLYNFTEAGFRMVTLTWVFYLLATAAVPEAGVPEGRPALVLGHADNFAETESQVEYTPGVGFREETL